MEITICIPDSILTERPSLLSKTEKVGEIVRAASIFGVKKLLIYHDKEDGSLYDMKLFETLTKYLLTPPYLRKYAFPMRNELKYVGMLPPINVPSHIVSKDENLRYGLVIKRGNKTYIETGIGKEAKLEGYKNAANGDIVPIKLIKMGSEVFAVKHEFKGYSGFSVERIMDLNAFIDALDYANNTVIFTSREGEPISVKWKALAEKMRESGSTILLFGTPKRGFEDMLELSYRSSGFWVNVAEYQAVKTIRTEEALLISLGLVNFLAHL